MEMTFAIIDYPNNIKIQAQLGVPQSKIQVEAAFISQAGTYQILNEEGGGKED